MEEEVGSEGKDDRCGPELLQQPLSGRRHREEIDRHGPVMSKGETYLAVAIRRRRHLWAASRQSGDPRRAMGRKRRCVVMPGEQRRLENDRDDAKYRGRQARRA